MGLLGLLLLAVCACGPAESPPAEAQGRAPYPQSPVISEIVFDPPERVVRAAAGSDTFPITWGADGGLFVAFADGFGFEPKLRIKLSLGLARVSGSPPVFEGRNLRSVTFERFGDGSRGPKASGLLMVDGVLYALIRNANRRGRQCQLAWSEDGGRSFVWADWRFEDLGYCTFLNFGRDYAGARDDYVYLYSPDGPSAYEAADRMILMRVPRDQVRERAAWDWFAGMAGSEASWSADPARRVGVFRHPGRCLRSGISYDAGIGRYLWWQGLPTDADERFEGGFGVYDAPEPWGPWTTAFFDESWDMGPGETGSFPTKWMSADGKTLHLIFSGDDHFSVRRARLVLSAEGP